MIQNEQVHGRTVNDRNDAVDCDKQRAGELRYSEKTKREAGQGKIIAHTRAKIAVGVEN